MDVLFLDANVLFSAAYREDAGLRRLWALTDVKLVSSAYAVEEARRNLDARDKALDKLLEAVVIATSIPPATEQGWEIIALPDKDLPILQAAVWQGATHLLTGDMRHFGRYFGQRLLGVLILPPSAYWRLRSTNLAPAP
ncbi:MAG: hypothetical protein KGZ60_13620 [Truepera sp.]|nr:hypothetical protein [Truepera sp.]MBS3968034.1 hypothetical protein [Truepera sp.]MBS3968291.1 hypothetical protein [Truepera sp.]